MHIKLVNIPVQFSKKCKGDFINSYIETVMLLTLGENTVL